MPLLAELLKVGMLFVDVAAYINKYQTPNMIFGLLLFLLPSFSTILAQLTCDTYIFGSPVRYDCSGAYDKLPYALEPVGGAPDRVRVFVEPQYLAEPFSRVQNPYGKGVEMVQLPKIWRSGWFS